MENVYPKMMNVPPVLPTAVSPAHYPYPQVNVFDIEQKHIDNYYMAPAHVKALPVAAAPIYHHPVRPRPRYSDLGIILVLYILLVILLRASFFGGKFC